eukprot:g7075.t1
MHLQKAAGMPVALGESSEEHGAPRPRASWRRQTVARGLHLPLLPCRPCEGLRLLFAETFATSLAGTTIRTMNFGKPDVADNVNRLLAQWDPANNGGRPQYFKNCQIARRDFLGGYRFSDTDSDKKCEPNIFSAQWSGANADGKGSRRFTFHSKSRQGGPEVLYSDAEQRARGQSCFPEAKIQYLQGFDELRFGGGWKAVAFLCMTDDDTDNTPKALLYKNYGDATDDVRLCDDLGRPTWESGEDIIFGHLDGIPNVPTGTGRLNETEHNASASSEENGDGKKSGRRSAKGEEVNTSKTEAVLTKIPAPPFRYVNCGRDGDTNYTGHPDVAENVNRLFSITVGKPEWSSCKIESSDEMGGTDKLFGEPELLEKVRKHEFDLPWRGRVTDTSVDPKLYSKFFHTQKNYRYVSCGTHDKDNFGKPDVADNVNRLLAQWDPASNGGEIKEPYFKNCKITRSNILGGYNFSAANDSEQKGMCQQKYAEHPWLLHSKFRPGGPEVLFSSDRGQSCFPEGGIQYLQAFDIGLFFGGFATGALLCMTDDDTDNTPKALAYKRASASGAHFCDDLGRATWVLGGDYIFGHLDGIPYPHVSTETVRLHVQASGEENVDDEDGADETGDKEDDSTLKTDTEDNKKRIPTTRIRTTTAAHAVLPTKIPASPFRYVNCAIDNGEDFIGPPEVAENVNRLFAITEDDGDRSWSSCKIEPRPDLGGLIPSPDSCVQLRSICTPNPQHLGDLGDYHGLDAPYIDLKRDVLFGDTEFLEKVRKHDFDLPWRDRVTDTKVDPRRYPKFFSAAAAPCTAGAADLESGAGADGGDDACP